MQCTIEFISIEPIVGFEPNVTEELKRDNNVVLIVGDNTAKGLREILGYLCSPEYDRSKVYYRIAIPFTSKSMTPLQCLEKYPNDNGPVVGKVKWSSDLTRYPFVRIESIEEIRRNTDCAEDVFKTPNIWDGLNAIQVYALGAWTSSSTLHELACRCVSRFDIQISECMEYLHQVFTTSRVLYEGGCVPKFNLDEKVIIPRHICGRATLSEMDVIEWLRAKCSGMTTRCYSMQVNRRYVTTGRIVENVSVSEALELWLHVKKDVIRCEKKSRIEANTDESTYEHNKMTFLQRLFLMTYKNFFSMPESEKRAELCRLFGDHDAELLLNLPLKLIGPEALQDVSFEEYSTGNTRNTGYIDFLHKSSSSIIMDELSSFESVSG